MRDKIIKTILALLFLSGLSLLLYPTVSDYWNSFHQSQAVVAYSEKVAVIDKEEYNRYWEEAIAYNEQLREAENAFAVTEERRAEYDSLLDVSGLGVMGYIEIPKIKCSLPIYHGTDESVLQVAIGHLEWTSLPTGGIGNHIVVSGHRGLPSAKLFTDLDQLMEGDTFVIRVLDEILTYEVDRILIVEPHQTEALELVEGKDLCTLVTCTPYGVNSHRLLVRGHRVENLPEARDIRVTSDAIQIDPIVVAPIVALPMIILLFIWLLVYYRR